MKQHYDTEHRIRQAEDLKDSTDASTQREVRTPLFTFSQIVLPTLSTNQPPATAMQSKALYISHAPPFLILTACDDEGDVC